MVYGEEAFRPQSRAMSFIYKENAVAAYPPGTGLIYRPGTTVDYIAGASVIYVFATTIAFTEETTIFRQSGPETFEAGAKFTFPAGAQIAYGPGSTVLFPNGGEVKYAEFNGNTHAIAAYPKETSVQYYYGPKGSNLILFAPGSNPLTFYNPGGSTQFGPSAVPVEKEPINAAEPGTLTRTYGCRGGGYSYCSGYSYNGWPQTTYYNSNSGYRSTCSQYGYNSYNYGYSYGGGGGGGMGGGGGGGMGGGYSGYGK